MSEKRMSSKRAKPIRSFALLAAFFMLAAACSPAPQDTAGGGDETPSTPDNTDLPTSRQPVGPAEGNTMVFGTAQDPVVLDGILVSDGESLRVIDQLFEGLVKTEEGGTDVEPQLAESWRTSADGLEWSFTLRDDVKFHDGTDFNAEAVCFNFDRWYNLEGSFQNPDATYYWQTVFGGFANPDPASGSPVTSLYASCEATRADRATITLTKPSSSFLSAMALSNFTFASPAALEEFDADAGEVDADGIFRPTGTYSTEHPTGTGPFVFSDWVRGDRLILTRNPDYWGEAPGNIDTLIFRPVPDSSARLQALQTGELTGYDFVQPEDFATIEGDGNQILERPAFNVGYLGFSQSDPDGNPNILANPAVRRAIAHAINRQAVVDGFYAGQGEVAQEFMPPELFGYADDVTTYDYDPEKARQILTDAGLELPVPIRFAYPTDISRPYMLDPQANFEAMRADLDAAGFAVTPESAAWSPDYLGNVNNGAYELYLLGWTGDFGDPDNFIGTFFQTPQPQWGFDEPEIFDLLDEAEAETNAANRVKLYEQANRVIMDFLPGLPYVHTKPALAFTPDVEGYIPSPVSLEPFDIVSVGGV